MSDMAYGFPMCYYIFLVNQFSFKGVIFMEEISNILGCPPSPVSYDYTYPRSLVIFWFRLVFTLFLFLFPVSQMLRC